MRSLHRRTAFAALLSLLATGGRGQDRSAAMPYSIPGHGTLKLKVPEGWRVARKSVEQPASLHLRFSPSTGKDRALRMLADAIHSR